MRSLSILMLFAGITIINSCTSYPPTVLNVPIKAGLSENCDFTDMSPDMDIPTPDYQGYGYTYGHASGSGEDEIEETGLWKDTDRKCIAFKMLLAGK